MARGPTFRKRTTLGGPPTDLPEQPLVYPGKPLAHRYTPTETSRRFEEPISSDQNKLAGDTPFTPVASINFIDKNIHIGPIGNEHPRSLTPIALSGRVLLPRRGAGIFELPEEIRGPLEARIGRLSPTAVIPDPQATTPSMEAAALPQQEADAPATQQTTNTRGVHTELEKLRELARQELAKRQSADQTQPSTPPLTSQISTQPVISSEQSSQPVESPTVEKTPETRVFQSQTSIPSKSEAAKISPKPEDETLKLLSEAKKLEAELSKLSSGVSTIQGHNEEVVPLPKPPLNQHPKPPTPPPDGQKKDWHLDRIDQEVSEKSELSKKVSELNSSYEEGLKRVNQLVSEKSELSKKVSDLKSSYEEELNRTNQLVSEKEGLTKKVSDLESSNKEQVARISQLVSEKEELTKKVSDLESSNKEQVARISQLVSEKNSLYKKIVELNSSYTHEKQQRQGAEEQIKTVSGEFERKLTQAQIERTNLVDQVQKLKQETTESSQANEANESEIGALKSRLATAEKERDDSKAHMKKVDSWVRELGQKTGQHDKPPTHSVKTADKEEPKVETKETPKEEPAKARVVKPQLAIGKMAPALTNVPNIINGIIKDQKGLMLSNVIIVVKDSNDQPVRALKSNKIGQFAISTPLPNGIYTMALESPSHIFDIVQVDVDGKVMRPVEIRAVG
ncbi:hypothetical protein IH981_03450 [Patescibacteria group bacterium]|nr:hypothetical protein [Patescibacteria group bacterium]